VVHAVRPWVIETVQTLEVTTSPTNSCTNKFHISDKMTDTQKKICKFYNTGYCKYKRSCKFPHPTEICEKACKQKACHKRHPKPCRYGNKCRRKDTCDYKHNSSSTENDLKAEVEALKITIKLLLDENMGTKTKLADLENELKSVKENLKVKCSQPKKKESKVISEREEISLEDIIRENSIDFKCDKCDHSSKTERLLKRHKGESHFSSDAEVFAADPPFDGRKVSQTCLKCSLCEFKSKTEKTQSQASVDKMQAHMQAKHDLTKDEDYFFLQGCGGLDKGLYGTWGSLRIVKR